MIRSGERATENTAKTKNSASTQFSDMLKGMTQTASEDKKVSGSKQEEENKSAGKKDSKEVDKEKEEPTQKTEKTDKKDTKEEEAKTLVNELTGEGFTQLAEMLAALSQNNGSVNEEQQTIGQGELTEVSLEAVTEILGEEAVNIADTVPTTEQTAVQEPVTTKVQTDEADAELPIQTTVQVQETQEVPVQAEDGTALIQQFQSTEEAVPLEVPEKENIHTDEHDKAVVSDKATEAETKVSEAMVSAAAEQNAIPAFTNMESGVEKMTMKTSPERLPQDLADTIVSKDMLGNGTPTLEITLEPATLGKITLRVVYQEGRAAMSLISDSPKTLELLSQKAGEIAQILQEKTGQETMVFIPETSYTEQGQEDNGQQGGREREQRERPKQEQTESFAQQLRLGLL